LNDCLFEFSWLAINDGMENTIRKRIADTVKTTQFLCIMAASGIGSCIDGEIQSTPCTPASGGHGLNRSIPDFWLTNCTLYHKHPACGVLPSSWKLELLFFPSPLLMTFLQKIGNAPDKY
jgi:hypothetical protein